MKIDGGECTIDKYLFRCTAGYFIACSERHFYFHNPCSTSLFTSEVVSNVRKKRCQGRKLSDSDVSKDNDMIKKLGLARLNPLHFQNYTSSLYLRLFEVKD